MPLLRWNSLQLITLGMSAIVLLIVILLVPALGVFDTPHLPPAEGRPREGRVVEVLEAETVSTARGAVHYQRLAVAVGGQVVTVEQSGQGQGALVFRFRPGDRVLVGTSISAGEGEHYYITDRVRRPSLVVLALAFAALVLVVGGLHGLRSLLGLGISFLVIVRFIIPGIISGADPVLIAVLGGLVIMLTTLYLAHGVNAKTTVALAGTGISLALTALLSLFSIPFARLTGIAGEDAATLQILSGGGLNAEGLLLAGILIGALGVLDDVTVAQASSVFELRRANPRLTEMDLYRRGMNVGRDHIASTVNTLVLAYAGAALPLLILLSLQTEPLNVLLNREFLATEIVRTLVGSMGIVAAVPVTTALASLAAVRLQEAKVIEAPETRRPQRRPRLPGC